MLYYLLELHDTKTDAGMTSDELTLYYLLELHDTKTRDLKKYMKEKLYYLLELHDTKTYDPNAKAVLLVILPFRIT